MFSLFLVSTTEVYQLLKIPTLIEHYWEHKNLNPEMSLIAFLKTHYEHPIKDGDFGKDQKLPFVVHEKPLNLVFTYVQNFNFQIQGGDLKKIISHKMPSKDDDHCLKGFVNSVWEPPKFNIS
jgi:hypothetical protein